jgi:hypothetical protein
MRDARKGSSPKVLKVAAVHRRAVNVHPGPQHEMDPARPGVLADHGADLSGQIRVPRSGQADTRREGGGGTVVPDPDRAVGHLEGRQVPSGAPPSRKSRCSRRCNLPFSSRVIFLRMAWARSSIWDGAGCCAPAGLMPHKGLPQQSKTIRIIFFMIYPFQSGPHSAGIIVAIRFIRKYGFK